MNFSSSLNQPITKINMKYLKNILKPCMISFTSKKMMAAIALIAAVVVPASSAQGYSWNPYHTLRIANTGLALNTNNYFRRVYGQPRMSISLHNTRDWDQQFRAIPVNSDDYIYFGLQHRSTGKCLNVYNPRLINGVEVNLWPCNPDDKDQMFARGPFQGDTYQIATYNGNFCLDSPTRNRYGRIHVWTCDRNNPNQQWTETPAQ